MDIIIVTGMSGAGKSSVMNILEDIGYFCIDNMPPQMIFQFAQLCKESNEIKRVAIATDIRGGTMLLKLNDSIVELTEAGFLVKTLFLTAQKDVLIKRFKETRRKHPLDELSGGDLDKALEAEAQFLSNIKENADFIIDTSAMNSSKLKETIVSLFLEKNSDSIIVNVNSFGFKYSTPAESDLVFDVRCLPNPYYEPNLRELTGLDERVQNYVMSFDQARSLEEKYFDLLVFSLPLYVFEGKSQLVIAFGCTGGKHRSVTFAERTAAFLTDKGYNVRITHRDIDK